MHAVEALISAGADVRIAKESGQTALDLAVDWLSRGRARNRLPQRRIQALESIVQTLQHESYDPVLNLTLLMNNHLHRRQSA